MAGRYVILEFDDKNQAEAFLAQKVALEYDGAHVLALFMKPKKFCSCPGKRDVRHWAKGKRTGLYLCKVCKLPSSHHETGIMSRLQYVFGFNQLEGSGG